MGANEVMNSIDAKTVRGGVPRKDPLQRPRQKQGREPEENPPYAGREHPPPFSALRVLFAMHVYYVSDQMPRDLKGGLGSKSLHVSRYNR